MNDEQYEIMASLFESSDEEQEDFHGFDLEFEALFNSSREDDASEFLGFDLGFEALFNSSAESNTEFLGF